MPRAKRVRSEADPDAAAAAAAPVAKRSRTRKDAGKQTIAEAQTKQAPVKPSKPVKKASGGSASKKKPICRTSLEWITICRPFSDIYAERMQKETEDDDDEDEDSDDHYDDITPVEGEDNALRCLRKGCVCDKPAAENPTWKWIISRQARRMHIDLGKEAWKRNQDAHGQYHYNDFTGYGFQEAVENMVSMDETM